MQELQHRAVRDIQSVFAKAFMHSISIRLSVRALHTIPVNVSIATRLCEVPKPIRYWRANLCRPVHIPLARVPGLDLVSISNQMGNIKQMKGIKLHIS